MKTRTDMDEKLSFLCNIIYETTGISIFCYNSALQTVFSLSKWENHIKNFFFLNCPYDLPALLKCEDSTPLYYSDSLHLSWFLNRMSPLLFFRKRWNFGPCLFPPRYTF